MGSWRWCPWLVYVVCSGLHPSSLRALQADAMAKLKNKRGIKLNMKLIHRVLREYAKQDAKTGRKQ